MSMHQGWSITGGIWRGPGSCAGPSIRFRPSAILDVGCGPGLMVGYLRQRGYDCRGCDLGSPTVIETARAAVWTETDALQVDADFPPECAAHPAARCARTFARSGGVPGIATQRLSELDEASSSRFRRAASCGRPWTIISGITAATTGRWSRACSPAAVSRLAAAAIRLSFALSADAAASPPAYAFNGDPRAARPFAVSYSGGGMVCRRGANAGPGLQALRSSPSASCRQQLRAAGFGLVGSTDPTLVGADGEQ